MELLYPENAPAISSSRDEKNKNAKKRSSEMMFGVSYSVAVSPLGIP